MRTRGPQGLQKSKEDGLEHLWGAPEYRKPKVVSGLLEYVPQLCSNSDLPTNKVTARLFVLVG